MEKTTFLLVVLAILLVGSVVAGSIAVNKFYLKNVPSSCADFTGRNYFIWLPEKVSDVLYGDVVILHFSMIDGNSITIHGVVEDSAIARLRCGRTPDYDFEVWMSDINALGLATSVKPTTTFVRLWRTGEIRIEPSGKENEMKLAYADQLVAQDNEPVPEWIRELFGRYIR